MNKKKGFSLVELLAVLIILILIIVMAIVLVKNHTKDAKEKSVEANARGYIKAVDTYIVSLKGTDDEIISDIIDVADLNNNRVKISGEYPDSGYVFISEGGTALACLKYGNYVFNYADGKGTISDEGECVADLTSKYSYTGKPQKFNVAVAGYYKVQLWGASGGQAICNGGLCGTPGKGGYAEGVIELNAGDVLHVYVGEKGSRGLMNQNAPATFNGGGFGTPDYETVASDYEAAGAGGGATDVRLVGGDWNNAQSLASRIMVAGGGGGNSYNRSAGAGGGLVGGNGNHETRAAGGTQTTGYAFGKGKNGSGAGNSDGVGGGGGGYWGGLSQDATEGESAGGGSGYISGHLGCVAIQSQNSTSPKTGCNNGTTDIECSYHYSGKKFINTVLTAGSASMPTFDGTSTMTGNSSNGYAIISYLGLDYDPDDA